jgi:NAD(P)-dependent dehydrogenase (short-subunit alcohol dehydrogenase family)
MNGVALVTGASSGIGAATAAELASRGYRVALLGRRESALATVMDSLVRPPVGEHLAIACDVTDPGSVQAAVDRTCDELGVPEAVVTAAGVCVPASVANTTVGIWQATMEVNVSGTFHVLRAVSIALRKAESQGSFVLVGSEQSLLGVPNYAAYATSKAALVGLTKSLAAELAPSIRVNMLCPGPVDTPMLDAEFKLSGDASRARAAEIQRVPLRRIATAAETALSAVWLLIDAAYATGALFNLDGGTTGAFMASA